MIVVSFCFFLLLFVGVGVASSVRHRHTSADYLLAGQTVQPWLVALAAVATNSSGFMFIGMIGYTYAVGLSSLWLALGWVIGDFIASLYVHKKLRIATEREQVLSFAGVLSHWHGTSYRTLRFVGGLITIAFLGTYAAAQLKAGSKALEVLFGWDASVGAIIGAMMVFLYCFAGGIRASIWTNAAQSFVMFVAMIILMLASIITIGGVDAFNEALHNVSPDYMSWFASDMPLGMIGPILFVFGWLMAGFGVIGQPHIMANFMAMDNPQSIKRVRVYYYFWFSTFFLMTVVVGLAARILLPEVSSFDAELALPTLAQQQLPEVLVGLILAGLFAATMSTADSQILCCTAALTRDLIPKANKPSYMKTKLATMFITLIALTIALGGNESVFGLVTLSWAALACAFAPLLMVYSFGGKPSEYLALAMVAVGLVSMMLWRYLGLSDVMYEVAPGIAGGLLIYVLGRVLSKPAA